MTILPFWFPEHYWREGSTVCPERILSCICLSGFRRVCLGPPQGQWLWAFPSLGVAGSGRRDRWPPPSPPRRAGGRIADDKGTLDDRPWPVQLHLARVHVAGKVIAAIFCQHEKYKSVFFFHNLNQDCSIPLKNFPKNHAKESSVPKVWRRLVKALPSMTVKKWLAWV